MSEMFWFAGPMMFAIVGILAGIFGSSGHLLHTQVIGRYELLTKVRGKPPHLSLNAYETVCRLGLYAVSVACIVTAIAWTFTMAA